MGRGSTAISSNNLPKGTPRPAEIFSKITAVGLLSPRSTNESMERLTPLFPARASRLRRIWLRRARTDCAIRSLTSVFILDIYVHYIGQSQNESLAVFCGEVF